MANYVLTTCSTVDLEWEHLEKRNIDYFSFSYYLDSQEYKDDLGKSLSYDDFYKKMTDGVETKTAQPSLEDLKTFFRPYLEQGLDVFNLMLSSGLSGTYNTAQIVVKELSEEFPDRKIYIVDSLGASSGMGLFLDKIADLRDNGYTIDELRAWTEENRLKVHHWFFSTDLTFFVKGGRVSRVAGWFGTILKICPLLNVDNMGRLVPREKIRGKANVIKQIVKKMEENAENGLNYSGKCYISHSACYEDALAVKKLIEEKFKSLDGEVEIHSIGTTIGSHTGPGTVALFFFGKERIN
ncbi:MAG: DegV family protein [Clostridia bacterium]|nr:DegV family protein [Clostridia bacterium]